jgi:pimeloyl-ACP methyl ester carboxylesterase
MEPEIHFCTTDDNVRIACATVGQGPPLVKAANWLSHLEYDWDSPIRRHLLAEAARDHTFIRYDERGNGLSDWNVADLSFEAFVEESHSPKPNRLCRWSCNASSPEPAKRRDPNVLKPSKIYRPICAH